jgi:polyisoprenoid-binding protein YceI
MKTSHLFITAALLASAQLAQAQQKLVPAQSSIGFVSKQMGVPVDGSFKKFEADVQFDPKKPETSKVSFAIDLTSVDIGDAGTMAELRKPGWFDSAKVPKATFTSTAVKATGAGKFEVAGNLTIKGLVKPVVVPVSLVQQGVGAGLTRAEGSFVIKRLDYRIGDGDWNDVSLVANDVQVKLKLVFSGVAPL